MKNALKVLVALLAVLVVLAACEPEKETKTVIQPYEVGDDYGNGFTVSYVDSLGGVLADRVLDLDDNGSDDLVQVIVAGRFGTDLTLTKDHDTYTTLDQYYVLSGPVFIGNDNANNCELTIEAGTLIKGIKSDVSPGALIITRGSTINAVGTPAEPIIMTSSQPVGERAAGDWGGLIINGNAPINDGDENGEAEGEGGSGTYGGSNAADNSGTLQYVSVRFAGTLFTASDELNGIAFQGVGNGTTVDYIHVHRNADDGIEFFGGTVNVKHCVITGVLDDSFDWTSGWSGTAQFVVLQQYDVSAEASDDPRVIEADNKEGNVDATPRSNPTLANFTVVGAGLDETVMLRRGTSITFLNSVVMSRDSSGDEDADQILEEYHSSGASVLPVYAGVILSSANVNALDSTVADTEVNYVATAAEEGWLQYVGSAGNVVNTSIYASFPATLFADSATQEDGVTAVPTSAIAGTDISTYVAANTALTATTYAGAIEAGGTDWTSGWVETPAN